MTESIGAIGGQDKFKDLGVFKLKEEQPKAETLGWAGGFNTNQLPGLLNGTLGATSSQG